MSIEMEIFGWVAFTVNFAAAFLNIFHGLTRRKIFNIYVGLASTLVAALVLTRLV